MTSSTVERAADLADQIRRGLAPHADPARAEEIRRYLKSDRQHLGVGIPALRASVRSAVGPGRRGGLAPESAWAVTRDLWPLGGAGSESADQIFEHCRAATEVLVLHTGRLTPSDLDDLEPYLRACRTWALLDEFAVRVAGVIARDHPGTPVDSTLDRWARDADFWVRRAALLAELAPLAAGQPMDRFARHADAMLDEREFFVRKAIGWVLRETAKKRPDDVLAFVAPRVGRLSGVTWREVARRLPDDAVRALEAQRTSVSGRSVRGQRVCASAHSNA